MKSIKVYSAIIFFVCLTNLLFAKCKDVVADFGFAPHSATNAFDYKFIDSSKVPSGAYVSRLWTFGDGSTANTSDPVHHYTAPGVYKVCLIVCVANSNSPTVFCCDTICKELRICTDIKVDFTFTISGQTVVYTAHSTSPSTPLNYFWSFQGGIPASVSGTPVATVQYPNAGTYQVCVKVMDAHGCYGYSCKNITIGSAPPPCDGVKAGFMLDGKNDNAVTLVAQPQKAGTLYQWKMDGTPLTNPNPNTAFKVTNIPPGTHQFCLIVYSAPTLSNVMIPCDDTCLSATFSGGCNVNAEWTWDHTSIGAIYFSSVPNPVGVTHKWDFGDGKTSDLPNPVHSYAAAGIYKVCHWVYTPGTVCRDSSCNEVKTISNTVCKSYFTWSQTIGTILGIAFTNQSSASNGDEIISYEWTFGDNTFSKDKNPVHTYTAPGRYNVCLKITTKNNCINYYCDSVFVQNINPQYCKSDFEWTATAGTSVIRFFGHPFVPAGDSIVMYKWTFGDGTSVIANNNTEHTYSSPGKYRACLTIKTKKGCISEYCDSVKSGSVINFGCRAGFKWAAASVTGAVSFFDASTVTPGDSIIRYYWTFGDNSNPSDSKNPVHNYNAAGKYIVCHTIATRNGCTSTFCDTVRIGQNTNTCKAQFTFGIDGCDTVSFINQSTGAFSNIEWKFGDGTGSKEPNPKHVYTYPGTYTVILTISNPLTNCQSTFYRVVVIHPCGSDTICGNVFNDNNGNRIFDAGDTPFAGMQVNFSGVNNFSVKTDSQGHYFTILPAGDHFVSIHLPAGCILTIPSGSNSTGSNPGSYYIPAGKRHRDCIYNFGINCNLVGICGVVYFDANGNGIKDAGENGMANARILLRDAAGKEYHAFTNSGGEYCIKVPTGTYKISPAVPLTTANCKIKPEVITVTATTPGQSYNGNNFGINCQTGSCDLKVTLTPNVSITPGFPTWFTIFVCNVGSTPTSGTVNFNYDGALEFVYANPAQTSADVTQRMVSWKVNAIAPGDCKYMVVHLKTKVNAAIGKITMSDAEVIPGSGCNDVNLKNNTDTTYKEITGSWDPNNKIAYLTNYTTNSKYQIISSLNSNQRIEYVINFQNKGNAPAYNVVVQDTLSDDLDAGSYEFIGASHPAFVTMNGKSVTYTFNDINLPAEIQDEPNSHGFVIFGINSKNGLPAGHVISDAAAIYFDFNQPVFTDDAAVIMIDLTGIKNESPAAATVTLAPNPVSDYTRISLTGTDKEGFTLKVMSLDGRLITEETSLSNTLNLSRKNLAAGLYIYEVIQNNQPVARGKMIVQ